MDLHLGFLFDRLVHFDKYGDFNKKFITIGQHLKGLKQYPDNIKLKLKRDCFLLFHENGNTYLIDTFKLPANVGDLVHTHHGTIPGVRLFNWKKESMPALLKRLTSFINKPELAIKMAATIIDPLIVGTVKIGTKRLGNVIRQSDIEEFRTDGATLDFSATIDRDLQPKINAKRKG